MPFVDFKCNCGTKVKDEFFKITSEYKKDCPGCGLPMNRIYTAIPFQFNFKAGWDAGLGAYVNSKKDREKIMREKGASFRD